MASHAELGRPLKGRVVAHSLPTEAEIKGNVSDWNAPLTHLDYALIELVEPAGAQPGGPEDIAKRGGEPRGFFAISDTRYDFSNAAMLVISQHPLGEHLLMSRAVGRFEVNQNGSRVRYDANTLNGSSGSSVIDGRGRLVALHHYGRKVKNQGVPIQAIAKDLKTKGFDFLVSST